MDSPQGNLMARNAPRVCCFDFDGTLADGYPAIAASVNRVRKKYGMTPLSVPEVKQHVGRGLDYLLKETVPPADTEADTLLYRSHYASVMKDGTVLLPGARETLEVLQAEGVKLVVCSNKPGPFTRELLEHLGLLRFLDAVFGPENVPRPKPAPDMLVAALRRQRVEAGDALYVGDMTVDIQTARAAGVPVWVVVTGSDTSALLQEAQPDRLLDDLEDFWPVWKEVYG
jgi:phosphoglycolate phosphatase